MKEFKKYVTEKLHIDKDTNTFNPSDFSNKDDVYEYAKYLGYKIEITGKSEERGGIYGFNIIYNNSVYLTMTFWEKDKFAYGYFNNNTNKFLYQQDYLISVESINEIGWNIFLNPNKYIEYLKNKSNASKNEKYLIKELSKLI